METPKFSKKDLLRVIEFLLRQIQEEQRLRMQAVGEMLDIRGHSIGESEVKARIREILNVQ